MPCRIRYKINRFRRKCMWFGGNTVRKNLCVRYPTYKQFLFLAKWLFKFHNDKVTCTSKDFMIEKYFQTGDMRVKSILWNDILKSRPILQVSTIWQIGNGIVRLWLDKRCGDSLCADFSNLFNIAY